MKLPRLRFSVRWLMALVAVVAIGLAVRAQVERRRARFTELLQENMTKQSINAISSGYFGPGAAITEERVRAEAEWRARVSAHYRRLIDKYERAMRHPWLPIAPDPPEPF